MIDSETREFRIYANQDSRTASERFDLTHKKLDTVETGIEVVKEKVGIVDNRLIRMADDWRHHDSRLQDFELDLKNHELQMWKMRKRNDTHSAKLRALEDEIAALRGSPRFRKGEGIDEYQGKSYYSPRYDKQDIDRRNLEFQREQRVSHRESYKDQMFGNDSENRFHGKHWERPLRYNEETSSERKMRLDMDRVDLHDGNFKPWNGRDVHYKPKGVSGTS